MTTSATPPALPSALPSAAPSSPTLGDRDFERYRADVYWRARRYFRRHEDAEDVQQETFFKAWRLLASFEQRCSFRTWLLAIADTCALDLIHSQRSDRNGVTLTRSWPVDAEGNERPLDDVCESPAPSPLRLVLAAEGIARLEACKSALTPKERRAFTMRYQDEMTDREIAFRLQMTEGSVGQLLQGARRKLRAVA